MNETFYHMFDIINDAIVVVDDRGVIVRVNSATEKLFLYDKTELIGQSLSLLMPSDLEKKHQIHFEDYILDPSFRKMGEFKDLKAKRKGGDLFEIDIALSYFSDKDKRYFLATVRDISEIKEVERGLITTNQNLQEFAYMLTHDLKAPLNNIESLLSILKSDAESKISNNGQQMMTMIKGEIKRMSLLVSDILEFSKAGKVDLEIAQFDFSQLLRQVIDSLVMPKGFGIALISPSAIIKTSHKQLFQVLSNLIGNAVKYHQRQDGRIEVSIHVLNNRLHVSVLDDGPGIDPAFHEKIFEMFGTANKEKRQDSTGVGLAIVKKIVQQNNGNISVKNAPLRGAHFEFDWQLM